MSSKRRSYEAGHKRKYLVVIDDTEECDRAVYWAARRAGRTKSGVVMLRVIEPGDRNQQWLGVADLMMAEQMEAEKKSLDKYAAREEDIAKVKVDRVIFVNMPDSQTAVAALQAGEIDFYEIPPTDLMGQLESDKNIKIEVLNPLGNVGQIRLNFLHPPFNNEKARQAMLYIVKQDDFMKATFGESHYWKTCGAYFACGTPMERRSS